MNEMSARECAESLKSVNNLLFDGDSEALQKAESDESKLAAGELVEVVHAMWIYERYVGMWPVGVKRPEQKCSHCENWSQVDSDYCPSCGALMDSDVGNLQDGKDDNSAVCCTSSTV